MYVVVLYNFHYFNDTHINMCVYIYGTQYITLVVLEILTSLYRVNHDYVLRIHHTLYYTG